MIVRNYLFCTALSLFSHVLQAQSLPPAPPAYVQAAEQQLVTQVNLLTTQVSLLTTLHNANAKAVQEFLACTAAAPASLTRLNAKKDNYALLDRWPADLQGGISQALRILQFQPTPSLLYPPTQDLILHRMVQYGEKMEVYQSVGASYGWATSLVIGLQMQCAAELAKSFK